MILAAVCRGTGEAAGSYQPVNKMFKLEVQFNLMTSTDEIKLVAVPAT